MQVCKLNLWQSFTSSLQDADLYYRTVAEFQSEASRLLVVPGRSAAGPSSSSAALLGRHRAKIVRTATTAAEALLRSVTCAQGFSSYSPGDGEEAAGPGDNPAAGFKDIWNRNEASNAAYVVRTASLLHRNLHDLLHHQEQDEVGMNAEGWGEIHTALQALWEVAQELYAPAATEEEAATESAGAGSGHAVLSAIQALLQLDLPRGVESHSGMQMEDDIGQSNGGCIVL